MPPLVLLVEDHALLRVILSRAIAELGCRVIAAGNGDEALRLLTSGVVPDLVLSDLRMPGEISGMDLARWLLARHPNLPVLLQTGYADVDTAGFAVLRKPFTGEQLTTALVALLPQLAARSNAQSSATTS